MPAEVGGVANQAKGVEQHAPGSGLGEGIHGTFEEGREKQDGKEGKDKRRANWRILWRADDDLLLVLFSRAVFILFVLTSITTQESADSYKECDGGLG